MQLVFLHGLESGPHGRKYQALAAAFDEVLAPDTQGLYAVEERFERIEAQTRDLRQALVVGSSFGGLMAALLASRHPERVGCLVLLAPAFHPRWAEALGELSPPPPGSVIVHGRGDSVVPIEGSRRFAERHAVELLEVDDEHGLAGQMELLVELVGARLEVS